MTDVDEQDLQKQMLRAEMENLEVAGQLMAGWGWVRDSLQEPYFAWLARRNRCFIFVGEERRRDVASFCHRVAIRNELRID